jgi:RimJ/RimL family protein N-acetyltransferase
MAEAVRLIKQVAFDQLHLCSLYAWAMEDNVASRRTLLKTGFREVGRIRRATSSAGVQVDRIFFDAVPEPDLTCPL